MSPRMKVMVVVGISATSTDGGVGEVEAALVSSAAGARAPCSG